MFKRLLKQIFPVALLKRWFLIYNQVRIKTIDKLLFAEFPSNRIQFIRKRQAYPFQITPTERTHFDARVRQYMSIWDNWEQEEYIVYLDQPCIIEPHYGWAIVESNRLFYPSLGMSRTLHQPKPHFIGMLRHQPVKEFDCIVSLRDTGEENYFHFYNDVLAKLMLLDEHLTLDKKIPVLISRKLWEKAFFQYFLNCTPLKNRHWVIQEDFYVKVKSAYFCKPLTHTKKYFDQILACVPHVPESNKANRRVFLTRSPNRLRFIENKLEIEKLCSKYEFEVVDADELNLSEQIQLFAQTRYLIGIHGAGLTNMLYRRDATLTVLEIFPPPTSGYLPFQYILMANMYGYKYDALIGEEDSRTYTGGFIVKSKQLESKIQSMLN